MQVEGHHAVGLPAVVATGARVSNAYPTIRGPGDSLPKGGLIPGGVRGFHGRLTKGFVRPATGMRPHTGTETRPRLLREAAVRNIGQWAEA